MNKYLKISRACYIVTLILIPLIVSPFSYTPYTLIKTFALSLGILLSFIFFILSNPKLLKLPNKFFIFFILFEILSGIINPDYSLFPRYSEGPVVSIIIFFVIFLALNLFKKFDFEITIIYASFPVTLASLIDIFVYDTRASGTLGQANFLGFFMVITILTLVNRFTDFENSFRKFLFFYLTLLFLVFIKSASVASLLALILGGFFLRNKIIFSKKVYLIAISIISFIFILFGNIYTNKILDIYNQLFNPKQTIISDSFLIRRVIWSETIDIIKANPQKSILGFGVNSFNYYFEKTRKDSLDNYSEKHLLFDKPHNFFLEIIFSNGLISALILIYLIYKSIKNKAENNYLIFAFIFFLFFNWLDLFLKIIFYIVLIAGHESFEIPKNRNLELFFLYLLSFSFYFFLILFYKDTSFYLGNSAYIFGYNTSDLMQFKYKNPVLLTESLKYLDQDNKKKIFDYLIGNFSGNEAILFQLNKLF